MALGKPIVQFDLTEGRVSAQDASVYAERNDPADFGDQVLALLDDPERRKRWAPSDGDGFTTSLHGLTRRQNSSRPMTGYSPDCRERGRGPRTRAGRPTSGPSSTDPALPPGLLPSQANARTTRPVFLCGACVGSRRRPLRVPRQAGGPSPWFGKGSSAAPPKAEAQSPVPLQGLGSMRSATCMAGPTSSTRIFAKIDADAARHPDKRCQTVLLGDYVDRGPNSSRVIDLLIAREQVQRDNPAHRQPRGHDAPVPGQFRPLGGLGSARRSTDAPLLRTSPFSSDVRDPVGQLAKAFAAALPRSHRVSGAPALHLRERRLPFRPCGLETGTSPSPSRNSKTSSGSATSSSTSGAGSKRCVVHGHTPAEKPELLPNRINIDTGAYATGQLSCLVLDDDKVTFFKFKILRRFSRCDAILANTLLQKIVAWPQHPGRDCVGQPRSIAVTTGTMLPTVKVQSRSGCRAIVDQAVLNDNKPRGGASPRTRCVRHWSRKTAPRAIEVRARRGSAARR